MRSEKLKQIQFVIALLSLVFYTASPSFAKENVLQLLEKEFQKVVTSARPAVVKVVSTHSTALQLQPEEGSNPRKAGATSLSKKLLITRQNIGSGIVIDTDGHVVTTMLDMDANKIEVIFNDSTVSPAKLLGVDVLTDIAVLQVERKVPGRLKRGDSSKINTGSWVVTMGSSYGNNPIISFGIVSGWDTLPDQFCAKLIKINAPVTPGNSGGAVVNTAGEVVGMILAVLTEPTGWNPHMNAILPQVVNDDITQLFGLGHAPPQSGGNSHLPSTQVWNNQEITFAIPIETVKSVATEIIKHGKVARGWLGVQIEAGEFGIYVTEVFEESPAHKSGLLAEDIILEFNNAPVQTYGELLRCVGSTMPNTEIILKIYRNGREQHYTVTLGER